MEHAKIQTTQARYSAARITGIYACVAIIWISLSDIVIELLVRDPDRLTRIQTLKGLFFVAITALLLFLLIRRDMRHLRRSERHYRVLFESSHDALFVTDLAGRFVDANAAALDLCGYTLHELQQRSRRDLMPETVRAAVSAQPRTGGSNQTIEACLQTSQAHGIPVEVAISSLAFDDQPVLLLAARDVSTRRDAEAALRHSEERLRILFEAAPVGVGMSRNGLTVSANPAYLAMFGFDNAAQIVGQPILDQIAPECHAEIRERNQRRESGAAESNDYETTGRRKDGTTFSLHVRVKRITLPDGPETLVFMTDITERKQAEALLRQSEERYRRLVEMSPDAIVVHSEGRIAFVNPTAVKLLGAENPQDLIGLPVIERIHPDSRAVIQERIRRSVREHVVADLMEAKVLRLDGQSIDVEVVGVPLVHEDKLVLQAVFRDITARKQAETQLRQQSARATILADISHHLAELHVDSDAILNTMVQQTAELVGDGCAIRLLSPDGQWLSSGVSYHTNPAARTMMHAILDSTPTHIDAGQPCKMFEPQRALLIPALSEVDMQRLLKPKYYAFAAHFKVHSVIVAPLRVQGCVIGSLTLVRDQTADRFTDDDLQFVQQLADRAAIGVENARLFHANQEELIERKRAESALRTAEERLRTVVTNAPILLFALDRDGIVVLAEGKGLHTLGIPATGMIGCSFFEVYRSLPGAQLNIPPNQVPARRALAGEDLISVDTFADCTFETHWTPLRNKHGEIDGVIGVATDITERRRAEATLRELEAREQAILHGTTDAVFLKDCEGHYLLMNPAGAAVIGKPIDEILGKADHDIFPPDVARSMQAVDRKVLEIGQTVESEEEIAFGGSMRTFMAVKSPYRANDGTILGVIGVARDITDRKQMERKLRDARDVYVTLVEEAPMLVWRTDATRQWDFVNKQWLTFTGSTPQQSLGTAWLNFIHSDDRAPILASVSAAVDRREPFSTEFRLQRHDGVYHWMVTRGTPYFDDQGEFAGYLGTCIDINERKRQEQIKDDFLALASHELKTPLAAIIGYIHLLQRWSTKYEFGERANQALTAMSSEGTRLDRLINDLLDVSRIQTGRLRLHFHLIDARPLVERCVANAAIALPDHPIMLSPMTESAILIHGDAQRLEQVVVNLLTNAAKYSPPNMPIWVRLDTHGDSLEITVRDRGLGIPQADLPYIFERFYQVQRPARESRPGLGLGLFITHEIVRQHGGSIVAESIEDEGSTFTVRLPLRQTTIHDITAVPSSVSSIA